MVFDTALNRMNFTLPSSNIFNLCSPVNFRHDPKHFKIVNKPDLSLTYSLHRGVEEGK